MRRLQDLTTSETAMLKTHMYHLFIVRISRPHKVMYIFCFEMPSLLIASHIKPWHVCDDKERLDKFNGLMLSPNIDALFDNGLITFDINGTIRETAKQGILDVQLVPEADDSVPAAVLSAFFQKRQTKKGRNGAGYFRAGGHSDR